MMNPLAAKQLEDGFHPHDDALLATRPRRMTIRDASSANYDDEADTDCSIAGDAPSRLVEAI